VCRLFIAPGVRKSRPRRRSTGETEPTRRGGIDMTAAPTSAALLDRPETASTKRFGAADRHERKLATRRTPFQRWLAKTHGEEVTLDQRLLDLCG
jgi:hypothetical protein